MKKVLLTSLMLISLSTFSQLAPKKQSVNLNLPGWDYAKTKEVKMSNGLLLGGLSFTVAGLLTPVTMTGKSGNQKADIWHQPKYMILGTGLSLVTVGAVFKICGK